ncbi:methionine aminopeptidase [Pectobacterium carotovorum]|nr:methionine aminopeptidase [Pectobacterium carotovorum]
MRSKTRKRNKDIVTRKVFWLSIPVILQAACALAALTHPSHLLV